MTFHFLISETEHILICSRAICIFSLWTICCLFFYQDVVFIFLSSASSYIVINITGFFLLSVVGLHPHILYSFEDFLSSSLFACKLLIWYNFRFIKKVAKIAQGIPICPLPRSIKCFSPSTKNCLQMCGSVRVPEK